MKKLITILLCMAAVSLQGIAQQQPPKVRTTPAVILLNKQKEQEKRNALKHKADSAYQAAAVKIKLRKQRK